MACTLGDEPSRLVQLITNFVVSTHEEDYLVNLLHFVVKNLVVFVLDRFEVLQHGHHEKSERLVIPREVAMLISSIAELGELEEFLIPLKKRHEQAFLVHSVCHELRQLASDLAVLVVMVSIVDVPLPSVSQQMLNIFSEI